MGAKPSLRRAPTRCLAASLPLLYLLGFAAGSWAWVPDPKEMFIPGKVVKTFKAGEEGKFKMEDGKVRRSANLLPVPPAPVP